MTVLWLPVPRRYEDFKLMISRGISQDLSRGESFILSLLRRCHIAILSALMHFVRPTLRSVYLYPWLGFDGFFAVVVMSHRINGSGTLRELK